MSQAEAAERDQRDQCVAERVCQAPDCDRPIGHRRRQALTCSDPCRLALAKERKRSEVGNGTVWLGDQKGYFKAPYSDRGYVDWKPQVKTQILIGHVRQILEEYAEHLPLTCRQIYYRMIAEWKYPKGKKFEQQLYGALGKARRARMIPFNHIRDDGIMGGNLWPSPEQVVEGWMLSAENYQCDLLKGQRARIQVWCEAGGMVPQLQQVADQFSVPVYSASGFSSLTAVRQIVDSCIWDTTGPTVLLHLGDCDPSGYSIFQHIHDDVPAFLEEDRRYPGQTFEAERVAITLAQISEHGLVPDKIETNDTRTRGWREQGLTHKVEIEALAPDVIGRLLKEAIERHVNQAILEPVRRQGAIDNNRLQTAVRWAKLSLWRAVDESARSASHEW
jgi:hypothetical protein